MVNVVKEEEKMIRTAGYPQVWKHIGKQRTIIEIRYKDRVEVYELKLKDKEIEGQDEEYYRNNGFKKVQEGDAR